MKRFAIVLTAAALLPGALAAAAPATLPGVADEETRIPSGEILDYHAGKGDVIFVRHRTDRWYRVALNEGCMDTGLSTDRLVFDSNVSGGQIDRFTRVYRPATGVSCSIKSIRRSAPPPLVDSDSPVPLD